MKNKTKTAILLLVVMLSCCVATFFSRYLQIVLIKINPIPFVLIYRTAESEGNNLEIELIYALFGNTLIEGVQYLDPLTTDYSIIKEDTVGYYRLEYIIDKNTLISGFTLIDDIDTKTLESLGNCEGPYQNITNDYCYVGDKNGIHFVEVNYNYEVFLQTANLVTIPNSQNYDADLFVDLGYGYAIYDGSEYYRGEKIEIADIESFKTITNNHSYIQFVTYAIDNVNIYYGSEIIGKNEPSLCDISSLQGQKKNLNNDYLIGCDNVYFKGLESDNVDVSSFTFPKISGNDAVNSSYYDLWMDKTSFYCGVEEVIDISQIEGKIIIQSKYDRPYGTENQYYFKLLSWNNDQYTNIIDFKCKEGEVSETVLY